MSNDGWCFSFILPSVVVYLLRQTYKGYEIMKAYGHSRHDKIECRYGCCTTKSGKAKNCRGVVDRANRKTARQDGMKAVSDGVKDLSSLDDCSQ